MEYGFYSLLAFFICASLIGFLKSPAQRLGWVDRPDSRKKHRRPVPVIGGVAMYLAFSFVLLLLPGRPNGWEALLTAMGMLTAIGVYDDVQRISPLVRFFFQGAAVMLTIKTGGLIISQLGDLFGFGPVMLGASAALYTIFCVVGVINAFNMSDGLDGLAGGFALVATGWLIVLSQTSPGQHQADFTTLLILAAAIMGFLAYNLRHPWRACASVFMGDAGSTMLGLVIGWFLVRLSQGETRVMVPMTAVWILAVPLLDAVTLMTRRALAGRSPFSADRQHLHHLLQAFGWSHSRVTAVLLLVAVSSGGVGAAAWWLRVPEHIQFYVFISLFLVYYQATARIWARLDGTSSIRMTASRRRKLVSWLLGSAHETG
jgi:UDP-GlcNAc:undecaprenyl-phosphate GlcNAc-1-phosphate transferase